jgi:ribosomal-protein-alanine N-acetyltransferase
MEMLPSFSTQRLAVRDWQDICREDVARMSLEAALPVILTEPVLRHLPSVLRHPGPGFEPLAWLETLTARAEVHVVELRDRAAPIGFLTLRTDRPHDSAPEIHVGYLFAEPAWGKGYATELVEAVVAASRHLGDVLLFAGVAVENPASMNVLRKAGFEPDPDRSTHELSVFRFRHG